MIIDITIIDALTVYTHLNFQKTKENNRLSIFNKNFEKNSYIKIIL